MKEAISHIFATNNNELLANGEIRQEKDEVTKLSFQISFDGYEQVMIVDDMRIFLKNNKGTNNSMSQDDE
jgi:hypothetical protein